MKELSIEEKAKRYDKAIKVAADIKAGIATYIIDRTPVVDAIFPELKESEDERIRKALITLLQHFCKGYRVSGLDFPVSYKDMLAWVEKNPAWSEEDKEMFDYVLDMIEWYDGKNKKRVRLVSDWLKSLKDRVQPQYKRGESYTKKDVDDAYLKGVTNTKNEIENNMKQILK